MSPTDPNTAVKKYFAGVTKAHQDAMPPSPEGAELDDPLLTQLVWSMMLWNGSVKHANAVMRRITSSIVDANELRICLPSEHEALCVVKADADRFRRLSSALHGLFDAYHEVTLEPLRETGKRETKAFLESLPGLPRFVGSRLMLLEFSGHAFPVDDRLADHLVAAGAADAGEGPDAIATRLERHFRAGEAMPNYAALEAAAAAPQAKKTTKKTTKKPAAKTKRAKNA